MRAPKGRGNPLSYYNGKSYTFTWEEGRNLVSAVQGTNTYIYAYDSNGIRTSKTVNGVKHEYLYASGKLLRETIYDTNGNLTDTLDFVYDHNGHPFALRYTAGGTTTNYYYITNLQGDVLNIITGQGAVVASYSYDPYGKVLTATGEMANINPLRYRGYYYDAETEFYYLQSRYYDPAICRIINADCFLSIGHGVLGYNMYAYCVNNPVLFIDYYGCIIEPAEGASEEQIEQYERAIEYLKTSETGKKLIERLEKSRHIFTIEFVDNDEMKYDSQTRTIYFDVNSGLPVGDQGQIQSAALGLAHEMGHAAQHLDGELDLSSDFAWFQTETFNLQKYENPIALELGEPTRENYLDCDSPVTMNNSTHFVKLVEYNHPFWHYILFWKLFTPYMVPTDFNTN